jgi:hypothetical protein
VKRGAALVGGLLLVYFALFTANSLTRGRIFSPDSMNYVEVARRLAAGDGLVQTTAGFNDPRFLADAPDPLPFTAQAPAYPLLIAALSVPGIEPADGALLWSALGALALVLGSGAVGYRLGGWAGAAGAAALVLLCLPLRVSGRCAWSDTVGAACALGALYAAAFPRAFLVAGLLAGLAFATRHALAAVAPFLCVLALLPGAPRLPRLARVVGGWLIAGGPVLLHNLLRAGYLLPPQNPSDQALARVAADFQYLLFGQWLGWGGEVVQATLLVALLALSILLAVRERPARVWLAWSLWYAVFIIAQRAHTHFDDLGPRLLLPTLIPLLAVAGVAATRRLPAPVALGLFAAAALWLGGREVNLLAQPPVPPLAERVRAVPRLAWIADHTAPGDLLIGDDTVDIPFCLGRRHVATFAPFPYTQHGDLARLLDFAQRRTAYAEGRVWLVVRNRGANPDAWRQPFGPWLADLVAQPQQPPAGLRWEATLPDAFVWEIVPRR